MMHGKQAKRQCKEMRSGDGTCHMAVTKPSTNVTHGGKHKMTPKAVAVKTEHMIREGKTPKQAYATAWSMRRAGRLTAAGQYKRKGR